MTMPEMARNIYDSLEAVHRLREAGLPEPHAEAVVREQVHLMEHNLATKADIAAIHADIEKLRLETVGKIEAVQATLQADIEKHQLETKADIEKHQLETKADIEKLRLETKADIATVRGNIEAAKADIVKWMVGANIGGVALIIAALKLL